MKRFGLLLITAASFLPGSMTGAEKEASFVPRIVKVHSEAEVDSLSDMGVDILRRRGDILLCYFPDTPTRSGKGASAKPRAITPTLDVAKTYFDAGTVQSGAAVGTPYTGKGVVVGLCDIGLDPLHPTFLDADGHSRIKRVVQYVEGEGIRLQLEGDDAYRRWKTDNPDMYHATHVCGILAGGGAGTPYAGIAPDAEIVATVSTLTEVGLLAGVEDIIDYGKEVGKPVVINISVGSYTGPHDGSSLFSQYLDMCADEAVIVLSSGNEGTRTNSLMSEFSPERTSVAFRLGNKAWDQFRMYGATDIWSGTSSPLSVALGLYDSNEKAIVRWNEPFQLTDGDSRVYVWSDGDSGDGDFPFEGELMVVGGVDPENGRHVTSLGYEFTSAERCVNGAYARYSLALKVEGQPGEDAEVYADGTYSRLVAMSGNPAPGADRSVSDLACGFNVICVGMYGNRDSVPQSHPEVFNDDEVYWEPTAFHAGHTVDYSSYGTLRDGRVLPHTVAPGGPLMSAESRIFHAAYPFHPHLRLGDTVWMPEGGTSMSSPYVAGYIATWLEAVPELTPADVRRIVAESNRFDIPEPEDPRNASGYFDPVHGLKLALRQAGVDPLPDAGLSPDDYVEAYDIAGVKRYAGAASGLSGMDRGVYVVRDSKGNVRKRMIN